MFTFQHPTLKNEKQLLSIQVISALNFKNMEEKKEHKLVLPDDVLDTGDGQSAK